MQKWKLDFSLVKFKMQIKIQCKDLLTFLFFSISNGFAIFLHFTINSWMQCNICIYIYIYIYIYMTNFMTNFSIRLHTFITVIFNTLCLVFQYCVPIVDFSEEKNSPQNVFHKTSLNERTILCLVETFHNFPIV